MGLYAIRSRGENGFRRSGVAFTHETWTLVADPTPAQMSEPSLEVVDLEDPNRIRLLGGKPFANIDEFAGHPDLEGLDGPGPNYKTLYEEVKADNDRLYETIDRLQDEIEAAPKTQDLESALSEISELKKQIDAAPKNRQVGLSSRTKQEPSTASTPSTGGEKAAPGPDTSAASTTSENSAPGTETGTQPEKTPEPQGETTPAQRNDSAVASADATVQTQTAPAGIPA